jgi:hypothetical protein
VFLSVLANKNGIKKTKQKKLTVRWSVAVDGWSEICGSDHPEQPPGQQQAGSY